jgi:hypothetical protein
MKKLSVICFAILSVFFMASCRGPQGPAGHDGQDGNANVASSTVTVRYDDWQWVNNCQWMVEIDYPAINDNVFDYGAVLVYMDMGGTWSQVPLTYYYDYINQDNSISICEASIEMAVLSDGGIRLFWTQSDFYDGIDVDPVDPSKHRSFDFKIVAIEASVFDSRSDVDFSNYEDVKTAFQLAD